MADDTSLPVEFHIQAWKPSGPDARNRCACDLNDPDANHFHVRGPGIRYHEPIEAPRLYVAEEIQRKLVVVWRSGIVEGKNQVRQGVMQAFGL